MAKNYTFAEAVEIIHAGVDTESIADIGRRYPILLHKVTKVTTKAGADFVDLMGYMPDYLTANKVNTALKNAVAGGNTETEAENEVEPDSAESVETETTGSTDYESMSGKELWELLGKAGKRKLAKSTKKADLVEACKQAFGAGATEVEADEADEAENEETSANPYEGKSAMELFKECKKRGIEAASRKTAKFYADLLVKDDAKSAEPKAAEEADDDWDEEEETEAPAKKAAKTKKEEKKPAKKAAKKEEPADDDDDWDI